MYDSRGHLIGSTVGNVSAGGDLLRCNESDSELVRTSYGIAEGLKAQHPASAPPGAPRTRGVLTGGYFIDVAEVDMQAYGVRALDWTIVTLLPSEDFLNQMQHFQNVNLGVAMAICAAAIALIAVLSTAIVRSLQRFSVDLTAVARLRLDEIAAKAQYRFSFLWEVVSIPPCDGRGDSGVSSARGPTLPSYPHGLFLPSGMYWKGFSGTFRMCQLCAFWHFLRFFLQVLQA